MYPSESYQNMRIKFMLILALLLVPNISIAQGRKDMCIEKKMQFYSGPGLKLEGILSIPTDCDEIKGPCPGIVLCHGPGGYNDPEVMQKDPIMPAVSRWLGEGGYVTLRFSYRGVGASEGPDYRLIPMEQVEDIRNAITFIRPAGVDQRVKCMVSANGMGDLGRWMREIRRYWEWIALAKALEEDRANRVLTGKSRLVEQSEIILNDPTTAQHRIQMEKENPEFKKSMLTLESADAIINFRPETVVNSISPRAAMWICAKNDTLVPVDQPRRMFEKAGEPKKLVILEDEEHHSLYFGKGFKKVMTHTTEWFDAHLKK
jgi:esterase/lipase